MKHIVSVSIGSKKRDHRAEVKFLGQTFYLERRGTDGDLHKAMDLIRELDGNVDALGMGGIDLYIWGGKRKYVFRQAKKIAAAAQKTPIVDGSGLKNTLERRVIYQIMQKQPELLQGKKVLMVSAMDRFGMAEALLEAGCQALYGDLIFALGVSVPIYRLKTLHSIIAPVVAPIVVQLPFKLLYPIGEKQEKRNPNSSFKKYYEWADVIAGDFHMIKRYLPERVEGKTIVTNTVTESDIELLRNSGVKQLITTTPEIQGRSFGTNVMEAMIICLINKPLADIIPEDYSEILDELDFQPRFVSLNNSGY